MDVAMDKLEVLKEDIPCDGFKIVHLKKHLSNYYANVICCQFESKEDLKNYWNEVVNNVAMHIQAELQTEIELFNIYIFFFAREVDEKLLYSIEQDKYSSRKIIIKGEIPENTEILKKLVEDKIFKFGIEKNDGKLMLDDLLKKYDETFYNFLRNIEGKEVENLDESIKILK